MTVVAAVQTGPAAAAPDEVVAAAFADVERSDGPAPDLVVFPELFSHPFWCVGLADPRFFEWAEPVDGPTVAAARDHCARLGCHAVVPFFERGAVAGEYFNSAAVIGPDGDLIAGLLPDGSTAGVYRKNAISAYNWDGAVNDEKYYFRVGSGYPVFPTALGKLGVLICYDRWFPEAWRLLGLGGAEIVCVPNASSGRAAGLFVPSIRTWAAQNVVFVVAANRAGSEEVGGVTTAFYGKSCIATPGGEVVAEARDAEPAVVAVSIDTGDVARARASLTMYRDRRPDLYGPLVAP